MLARIYCLAGSHERRSLCLRQTTCWISLRQQVARSWLGITSARSVLIAERGATFLASGMTDALGGIRPARGPSIHCASCGQAVLTAGLPYVLCARHARRVGNAACSFLLAQHYR